MSDFVHQYGGTSLTKKRPSPRTAMGPYVNSYCRVLGGGCFLSARYPNTTPPLLIRVLHFFGVTRP